MNSFRWFGQRVELDQDVLDAYRSVKDSGLPLFERHAAEAFVHESGYGWLLDPVECKKFAQVAQRRRIARRK